MTLAFVVVVVVVVDEPMTDEIDFSFLLTFFSFSLSPPLQRNSTTHHRPANAGGQTTPGEKVIKQALLQRDKAWREVERERAVSLSSPANCPSASLTSFPSLSPPSTPPHTIIPAPRLPGADLALPDRQATARRELVLGERETRERKREKEKKRKAVFRVRSKKNRRFQSLIVPFLLRTRSSLFSTSSLILSLSPSRSRKQAIAADPPETATSTSTARPSTTCVFDLVFSIFYHFFDRRTFDLLSTSSRPSLSHISLYPRPSPSLKT